MKKKLKIESLKVQSFVTQTDGAQVKGGLQPLTLQGVPTTDCLTGMYPTFGAPCPPLCA